MKLQIFVFVSLLVVTSCMQTEKASKEEYINSKEEISSLLDNWHKAAAEAKYANYFKLMDSISVFVGTDASEIWSKEQFAEFSKPYFDKGEAWSFEAIDRNIYFGKHNDVAWFDEVLDTWMGLCRGSGVLEASEGEWVIRHYVLSVAIPNEVIREVVEIKVERDSVFVQTFKE